MNETNIQSGPDLKQLRRAPFQIAAALLMHDARLLPLMLVALAAGSVAETVVVSSDISSAMLTNVLARLVQLMVICGVTLRWRYRLEYSHTIHVRPLVAFLRTCVFGFGLWGIFVIPSLVLSYVSNGVSNAVLFSPLIFLVVLGTIWSLRYYFYFVPLSLLGADLRRAALLSFRLGKKARWAALASMTTPAAISLLLVVGCFTPYPDGRSLMWSTLAAACEGVFWLLSTYTALGYALSLIEDSDWRAAGLDPYRVERLQTLKVQGDSWLATMLTPYTGLQIFFLTMLLFMGNIARDLQAPPATALLIKEIKVHDYRIEVTLELSDPEFEFRGFMPQGFSIATQTGDPIARELSSASLVPGEKGFTLFVPPSREPKLLYLEFKSNKTAEVLRSLDNMWLWYKSVPVLSVNQG